MVLGKQYSISMPRQVIAGPESINEIVSEVKAFNANKALLVTDNGVWSAGLVEKPAKLLKDSGMEVTVINDVPPEPEIGQVEQLVERARGCSCEIVIGIGGGSVMDTAKILAALIRNKENVRGLLESASHIYKGLPKIMIPTTSGTGSEATPNAIVTIPERSLKVGIISSSFIPECVILDPMLTLKLPPAITASTGIDAMAHAMECFISNKANPFSDMYALEAIRLISNNIIITYTEGMDIEARHHMLLGSFYGGMCISASGTTAVHALAYPLGGKHKIPHGVSNAMLLPYVMEFNKDVIEDKLVKIAAVMDLNDNLLNNSQLADKVIEKLFYLVKELDIPLNLKQYGIEESQIHSLVEDASKVTRLLDNNPKPLSKTDIYNIYKKLFR